jgi:hypothetical protein
VPVGHTAQHLQLLGAAAGSQELPGDLQPAQYDHCQDGRGRVVGIDRVADPSRLRPDQLGPAVQQPKQPRYQVGRDSADQPDELAARDRLPAAQVRQERPEFGRSSLVQVGKAGTRQPTRIQELSY